MALVLADRVRETTTTTGTGTVSLAGAVSGYQSFAVIGNGNTTYYCISNQSAPEWEVGIGTYTSSGTTLARTTVLASSNSGSLVSFSSGVKDVFVTYPSEKSVNYDGNNNVGIGTTAPAVKLAIVGTDAVLLPKGTTAQQPTGVAGYLRFNTDTNQFEGYNGSAWSSVGGATISNDTSTSSNVYPLFASATTGTALTVYTSNAKLLYKPSTGEFSASIPRASNGIFANSGTVSTSYTVATGDNAMSAGTITVANGVTVTVSNGSRWVVV